MPVNSVGIVTARDALTIDFDKKEMWSRVQNFIQLDVEAARELYSLGKDVRDWSVIWAQNDVRTHLDETFTTPISYRPFDNRYIFYVRFAQKTIPKHRKGTSKNKCFR